MHTMNMKIAFYFLNRSKGKEKIFGYCVGQYRYQQAAWCA